MTPPRLLLIDGAERESWYAPLQQAVTARWRFGAPPRLIENAQNEIDLAVVNDERALPHAVDIVRQLARQNIPTLHLLDGILEWRNTWANPTYTLGDEPAVPFLQPSLCHKIACVGRSQTRILESWGNLGKCEVVGLPRLDEVTQRVIERGAANKHNEFRLLIVTARTAGFTPEQLDTAERSLRDLKQWLADRPMLSGRTVRPVWRLTGELARRIGVESQLSNTFGSELIQVLGKVDAMICTPSTALLEGMLAGVPTALLDYHNCPCYVPAAWSITAPAHFDQVVPELAEPPAAKMLYQDTLLHDALECREPAGPRLVRLIDEMVRLGRECRESGQPLELPKRILADPQEGHHLPEERFDYRTLYPDHPVFGQLDRAELQIEIGHLRRELARQGVIERHPLWGPALRLRRRVKRLLGRLRRGGRAA